MLPVLMFVLGVQSVFAEVPTTPRYRADQSNDQHDYCQMAVSVDWDQHKAMAYPIGLRQNILLQDGVQVPLDMTVQAQAVTVRVGIMPPDSELDNLYIGVIATDDTKQVYGVIERTDPDGSIHVSMVPGNLGKIEGQMSDVYWIAAGDEDCH